MAIDCTVFVVENHHCWFCLLINLS